MVKNFYQKPWILDYFEPFQMVKVQNFLQPWWKIYICHWGRQNQKIQGALIKNSFCAPAENMRQAATGAHIQQSLSRVMKEKWIHYHYPQCPPPVTPSAHYDVFAHIFVQFVQSVCVLPVCMLFILWFFKIPWILDYFEPFQTVKFQNFLQPWWRISIKNPEF